MLVTVRGLVGTIGGGVGVLAWGWTGVRVLAEMNSDAVNDGYNPWWSIGTGGFGFLVMLGCIFVR